MSFALVLTLISIHLAAVMTPGANFLTVTQNALAYSRRRGLFTVGGVVTGNGVYITAGIVGFAAVISQSPLIYNLIRLVGAGYFLYMSYQLMRRGSRLAGTDAITASDTDISGGKAYRSGFLAAVSNPAGALYFLSVFTTVLPLSSTWGDKVFAGLLLTTITIVWYIGVAFLFSNARVRGWYGRAEIWMNRIFAVVWFLLAIKLLAG